MPGSFIAVHYPGSIRKGDDRISQEEYLKYLLEQYQNLIYSICLKSVGNPFDAEDLTQEVFPQKILIFLRYRTHPLLRRPCI